MKKFGFWGRSGIDNFFGLLAEIRDSDVRQCSCSECFVLQEVDTFLSHWSVLCFKLVDQVPRKNFLSDACGDGFDKIGRSFHVIIQELNETSTRSGFLEFYLTGRFNCRKLGDTIRDIVIQFFCKEALDRVVM
jgi:hypothetical protein